MAKILIGQVSSDKGDKTIVVSVHNRKTHPLYRKQYTVTKHIMAHDAKNEARQGDTVSISASRPMSAHKHHVLTKIIERPEIRHEETVGAITAEAEPKKPKKVDGALKKSKESAE
jgi:small subunit ribosomal protein S17